MEKHGLTRFVGASLKKRMGLSALKVSHEEQLIKLYAEIGNGSVFTEEGRGEEYPKLLPSSRSNYKVFKQNLRFFYLQVIDLHGILIIESLDGLTSCLGSTCKPEPKQEPPYIPPFFCLIKFDRIRSITQFFAAKTASRCIQRWKSVYRYREEYNQLFICCQLKRY